MVFFAIQGDTERYSPSSSSDPSCLTWTMSRKLSLSVHPVGCIECWPNRHSRKNRLPKGGFFLPDTPEGPVPPYSRMRLL